MNKTEYTEYGGFLPRGCVKRKIFSFLQKIKKVML